MPGKTAVTFIDLSKKNNQASIAHIWINSYIDELYIKKWLLHFIWYKNTQMRWSFVFLRSVGWPGATSFVYFRQMEEIFLLLSHFKPGTWAECIISCPFFFIFKLAWLQQRVFLRLDSKQKYAKFLSCSRWREPYKKQGSKYTVFGK